MQRGPITPSILLPTDASSEFLRHFLECVALDNVARLVLVEVPELDAAFEAAADLLHIILETAQRGETAVVNRLATAEDPRAGGAGDAAIGDHATCHEPFRKLEQLLDFGVPDDGFAGLGIEHSRHGFFDLVDE